MYIQTNSSKNTERERESDDDAMIMMILIPVADALSGTRCTIKIKLLCDEASSEVFLGVEE
jgi:hypothetical protein